MTPRPSKDGRPPLTREVIVDKAIELIDADGLEAFSMRRLGEALGVEAMAMYHYFPNKDAILDGVVARILEQTGPALPLESADWKTVMLSGPASAARALESHPKIGWLFLGRQYTTVQSLQMLEAPLQILRSAGFEGQDLIDAAHAIFAYAAGWYLLASGEGGTWSGPAEEALASVSAEAGEVTPMAMALASDLRDWNHGFDEGMMLLLEGLESKLRK
jgi:AcrR family transcriptional regulator